MVLLIDNYDSFTYNLRQYLGELGAEVSVYRNDAITIEKIKEIKPDQIIISPGPGRPESAGISIDLVKKLGQKIPILGVCLGHQAIGVAYGGKVLRAPLPVHGKTSMIYHNGEGLYKGLSNPFEATRYHSLIIDRKSLPADFMITSWTDDLIMGIRHKIHPVEGVQFHPESILTKEGKSLLSNFLNYSSKHNNS